jgi:hypothetical protein
MVETLETKKESDPVRKEASRDKKKSLRRSWRSSSPVTKLSVIFVGLGAVAGVGYVGVAIWQTIQARSAVYIEHSPLVINNRPPELLQPFICNREKGLQTGNINVFFQNVGNARAINVFPQYFREKVIPERRTGNVPPEDPPLDSCDNKVKGNMMFAPGQPFVTGIRQSSVTIPSSTEGSTFQFYFESCVYYSDDYGKNHGTCDTYRLFLANTNPLDVLSGSPSFVCDGTPKIGKFYGTGIGCQK